MFLNDTVPMITRNSIFLGGVLALILAALPLSGCNDSKARSSGAGSAPRMGVDVVEIRPQPLENKIYTTGSLLANEEVELRSEIAGRVTGVFFDEGRRVRKGDLMLKINDRELQAQLKRKELEEEMARDEETRKRGLYEMSGISREDFDRAVNALKMVQAEKEVIQSQLAKTEIVAPFDGVVGLRYVSEGSFVTANMLAATMQDVDPIKVEFSVPEKYARLLRDGTGITVWAGESEEPHTGTVYAVESKIDTGTRTMKARAKVPNPSERLIPGSFAKVEIILERLTDAIVIPAGAVVPELAGEKVYVYRDGKARSVPVKTGIRTEESIQIVNGLTPHDTLIVTGLLQLVDGRAVEIKTNRSADSS